MRRFYRGVLLSSTFATAQAGDPHAPVDLHLRDQLFLTNNLDFARSYLLLGENEVL